MKTYNAKKGDSIMENTGFSEFKKIHRNLYKKGDKYYRLFGHSITPNGCWVAAPRMVELKDINIGTGEDVYGSLAYEFDAAGTVSANHDFIARKHEEITRVKLSC